MTSTPKQRQLIAINCPEKDNRELLVLSLTNGLKKSAANLTFNQANRALVALGKQPIKTDCWGYFNTNNNQHRQIQSLLYTANITVPNGRWGEVADMLGWFSDFLKSKRSPVKKPLLKMIPTEVSKIIVALEGVAEWKNTI